MLASAALLPTLAQAADPARTAAGTSEAVAFYLIAAVVGACAIGCAVTRSIVRMAMLLFGTLTGVALLYFLMAASFLGVIQLVVYAGGTLIVIVFGVMLTSRMQGPTLQAGGWERLLVAGVVTALLAGLVTILTRAKWPPEAYPPAQFDVAQLGRALLEAYLVPFELASVLLLAVMIGAAYLVQPYSEPPGDSDER
jgi:NADH-quinone oxidoreductase subunit J